MLYSIKVSFARARFDIVPHVVDTDSPPFIKNFTRTARSIILSD